MRTKMMARVMAVVVLTVAAGIAAAQCPPATEGQQVLDVPPKIKIDGDNEAQNRTLTESVTVSQLRQVTFRFADMNRPHEGINEEFVILDSEVAASVAAYVEMHNGPDRDRSGRYEFLVLVDVVSQKIILEGGILKPDHNSPFETQWENPVLNKDPAALRRAWQDQDFWTRWVSSGS